MTVGTRGQEVTSSRVGAGHWLLHRPLAHRGLHNDLAPENSLKAFERASAAGFPIELDVRLLADGGVAVFHDASARRLTGEAGRISRFTTASLKRLRLQDGPERVPLLDDVLDLVAGRVGLLIEVKNESLSVGPLETAVLAALKDYGGDYALQSFNALTVRFFARHAPGIVRGQLAGASDKVAMPAALRYLTRHMLPRFSRRADYIGYELKALPNATMNGLKQKMPVIAWTVKTHEDELLARRLADNYIFEGVLPETPK